MPCGWRRPDTETHFRFATHNRRSRTICSPRKSTWPEAASRLTRPILHPVDELRVRKGGAEEITLSDVTPHRLQSLEGGAILDAFGNGLQREVVRQVDHGLHDLPVSRRGEHVRD